MKRKHLNKSEAIASKDLIQDLAICIGPSNNVWKVSEPQTQLHLLIHDLNGLNNENRNVTLPEIRPISVGSSDQKLSSMGKQGKKKCLMLPKMIGRREEIKSNPLSLIVTGHNNNLMSDCTMDTMEKPNFTNIVMKSKSVNNKQKEGKLQRLTHSPAIQFNAIPLSNQDSHLQVENQRIKSVLRAKEESR